MFAKLLFALTAAFALVIGSAAAPSVQASGIRGLTVTIYNYDDLEEEVFELLEPWRGAPSSSYICKRTRFLSINHYWGEGGIAGCNPDNVMIRYQGFLRVPRSGHYEFFNQTDDGFYLKIDETRVIYDWEVQGMEGYNSDGQKYLYARRNYAFEAWYFENEGAAGARLYYEFNDSGDVKIVPESWYRTLRSN